MKILSLLMFITLLVSCGNPSVENEQKTIEETTSQETVTELTDAMWDLDNMQKDESKVQVISYSYVNPAQEVNMDIAYNVDTENKISMIEVTSNNYDWLWDFNTSVKEVVIGLTLEQASEMELISGSSLTSAAFKEAIKSQL